NQELMRTYVVKTVEKKDYYRQEAKKYAEVSRTEELSVLEGPYFEWFENEKPKEEGNYLDNVQHGKWIYYYEDGKKMYEQTLVNGRQEGIVTSWYPEGPMESVKSYKNGMPDGKWIFYAKQEGKI